MKVTRHLLPFLAALTLWGALPAHGQGTGKMDKKNYIHTLTMADRLRVAVYQEDDLTTLVRVDARGHVNLPLLGEITIGGLTLVEAQTAIENAYKEGRYLRNPQVTINVEEYAVREVSISGQIRNPSRYTLPNHNQG